jgi:hypothetical protein
LLLFGIATVGFDIERARLSVERYGLEVRETLLELPGN